VLNVTYQFQAIWGLNNLDFTGYEKIYSSFGDMLPFEGPWEAPMGPIAISFKIVCVVIVVIYPLQAIWGLVHLDFSVYNQI
jgi:hypothetical protein